MQAVLLRLKAVQPRTSRVSKWRRCRLCCQRLCACCHPDWAEVLIFCQKRCSFFVWWGGCADTSLAGFAGFCIIKCSRRESNWSNGICYWSSGKINQPNDRGFSPDWFNQSGLTVLTAHNFYSDRAIAFYFGINLIFRLSVYFVEISALRYL